MKNSSMPAMPITDTNGLPFNEVPPETCSIGLTKREYFAGLAMQGFLSGMRSDEAVAFDDLADDARRCADALLEELDKE